MKITNGTKTYDVSNWDSVKVEKYLSAGWTKEKSEGYSKKKDVFKKQAKEEMFEEIVSEQPINLEENEHGGD